MKEVELLVFHSNEIKVYQNHALKTFISACPVQDPTMVRAVAMRSKMVGFPPGTTLGVS